MLDTVAASVPSSCRGAPRDRTMGGPCEMIGDVADLRLAPAQSVRRPEEAAECEVGTCRKSETASYARKGCVEAHHAMSCIRLGGLYERGEGVAMDAARGKRCVETALAALYDDAGAPDCQ
jgi:TPR repeat protein